MMRENYRRIIARENADGMRFRINSNICSLVR